MTSSRLKLAAALKFHRRHMLWTMHSEEVQTFIDNPEKKVLTGPALSLWDWVVHQSNCFKFCMLSPRQTGFCFNVFDIACGGVPLTVSRPHAESLCRSRFMPDS